MLMIVSAACMFLSCSKDIEKDAMEHLKLMMKEVLPQTKGAELLNVKTVYKSDSLCVIDFTLNAPESDGSRDVFPLEYIYIDVVNGDTPIRGESITNLDKRASIFYEPSESENAYAERLAKDGVDMKYIIFHTVAEVKEKYRNEIIKNAHHDVNHPQIEDKLTFSAAWLKFAAKGREVSDVKSKDIKL